MGERSRKRLEISIPGEGSGIPGTDPFMYVDPDNDVLLQDLRRKVQEEPLEMPKGRKAKGGAREGARRERGGGKQAKGAGGASEGAAPSGRGETSRGVSPRWLMFATAAIAGPVIALLLVLLMMRLRGPAEGVREPMAKEATPGVLPESPAASTSVATSPAATPSATPSATATPSAAPTLSTTSVAPKATDGSRWKAPKPAAETLVKPKPSAAEPMNAGSGAQGDVW